MEISEFPLCLFTQGQPIRLTPFASEFLELTNHSKHILIQHPLEFNTQLVQLCVLFLYRDQLSTRVE